MDTNELHEEIAALSGRVERQYQALLELAGACSHQSMVLSSLLEHHEDLATLNAEMAEIPAGVLTILRDQVTKADACRVSIKAILKPDLDAAAAQALDQTVACALSKFRPDAA